VQTTPKVFHQYHTNWVQLLFISMPIHIVINIDGPSMGLCENFSLYNIYWYY